MRRSTLILWSREERGVAMVVAILSSLIVMSLALVAVGLANHNTSQSAFDRKRLQGENAGEGGADAFFSLLKATPNPSMPCPAVAGAPNISADLPISPAAHYDTYASFFATWPPAPTPDLTCAQVQAGAIPAAVLVKSVGTAVNPGTGHPVQRTIESLARLTPIYGGLGQAIFSDLQLNFANKFTVNGNGSNNGDVYTNGNFSLSNNTVIGGSVYAQGSTTIAQGVVKANVWANTAVGLSSGIQVLGNTTSSTSSISLSNNSTIFGNAKAGTTISGGTINGTKTQNSPSGAPPQIPLPKYCWPGAATLATPPYCDASNTTLNAYAAAGYTVLPTFASCALAQAWINAMPAGSFVVRISPSCALSWGNNSTINIKGNLAIFTDGSITTVNQTNWNSVGGSWTVFFVRPYVYGLTCAGGANDINVSNNTNFNGLQVFSYSQCTINFGNNNAGGVNGQIIGGTVNITNQMVMNYVPITAPGFNLTGYDVGISYLREIANGT
jgi:cytoskeletal protein CcmA (bactofilin family)